MNTSNKKEGMTASLFRDVTRCRLVVIFWSFETTCWSRCPLKTEEIGGSKTAVGTYISTPVTSEKSEDLIHTAAEVGNYSRKRVTYIIVQT